MTQPSASRSKADRAAALNATSASARQAIAPAAPWIERLARVGYAGKALLYSMVGVLAFQAALGDGGRTTGSRGALTTLVRQRYGEVVLVVIAAGLFGYAAWRVIEAALDQEKHATGSTNSIARSRQSSVANSTSLDCRATPGRGSSRCVASASVRVESCSR